MASICPLHLRWCHLRYQSRLNVGTSAEECEPCALDPYVTSCLACGVNRMLEVLALGVRNMEPYNFVPIYAPTVELDVGLK